MRAARLLFLLLIIAGACHAQEFNEYFVQVGTNLRLPSEDNLPLYPLIGKNNELQRKFLLGGFSVGTTYTMPLFSKFDLRSSANFMRQAFWEQNMQFNKGPNPQDALGYTAASTTEYYLSVLARMHYVPRNHFSAGIGLGLEQLLSSAKYLDAPDVRIKNHHYRWIMPVAAAELA